MFTKSFIVQRRLLFFNNFSNIEYLTDYCNDTDWYFLIKNADSISFIKLISKSFILLSFKESLWYKLNYLFRKMSFSNLKSEVYDVFDGISLLS